ncbi:hypothetical protein [Luteolibacter soli]
MRIASLLFAFVLGCLVGVVIEYRLAEREKSALLARYGVRAEEPPKELSVEARGEALRMMQEEKDQEAAFLKRRSGNWISADGLKKAKLNDDILEFGSMPEWPDLDGRSFMLSKDGVFLTEAGRYLMQSSDGEPDTLSFIKRQRDTQGFTRLTLYREGSPHAASRPPLPDTPPPPDIQKMLDLIPRMNEHEAVGAMIQRMAEAGVVVRKEGIADIIDFDADRGEKRLEFDLGFDDQWVLQRSEDAKGEVYRFRLFRTWVKDRREGGDPEVERVVYPYYEFGRIITGPMESRAAESEEKGGGVR